MKPEDKEDTINKSVLLNWLYSAGNEVSIEQLGQWISAKTNGTYTIVKKEHRQGSIEHSKLK